MVSGLLSCSASAFQTNQLVLFIINDRLVGEIKEKLYRRVAPALISALFCAAPAARAADPLEFFETRVRPVLVNNCFACHTNSQLGGLRLDSRDAMLKGGKSGPALIPGQPDESRLIQAIRQTDPKKRMPMGGKLKENEITALAAWVKMGAPWSEAPAVSTRQNFRIDPIRRQFWSLQPIREPATPAVTAAAWPKNPIDRFVLAKLEAAGLKP